MNKKKRTFITTITMFLGIALAQGASAGVFDGRDINIKWEAWDENSPGNGGFLLMVTDEVDVIASDQKVPDVSDFHNSRGTIELWDIDFFEQTIDLTYTSRYVGDADHQYMHNSSMGFHFEDTKNNLPDIVNVSVDASFAPFSFNPELVTFDANNIYVDLQGSMCHIDGMGSMPDCENSASPTGYDNKIKLMVEFGADPVQQVDYGRIDAFFDWAEANYAEFFPNHVESGDIIGYYARHYPTANTYIGAKDGHLFIYGDVFGGMQDLGEIEQWFQQAGL